MKKAIFLIIVILSLGCSQAPPPKGHSEALEQALLMAGENRSELLQVLKHYTQDRKDSLKYRAAVFLIENMPYYSYFDSPLLTNYLDYYRLLAESKTKGMTYQECADEIRNTYGDFYLTETDVRHDLYEVSADYLIDNIEWAFKVWEGRPWGKNISFREFCEYILPYRIEDESLSYWREEYYNKFNSLVESFIKNNPAASEDPIAVTRYVLDIISNGREVYFTTIAPAELPHVGPKAAQWKSGSCRELSDYLQYACRALGLPARVDFMPIRGDDNVGHFWNAFTDQYGESYMTEYPNGLFKTRLDDRRWWSKIKVYRNTFSLNRKLKAEMDALETERPLFFQEPFFEDVTYHYAATNYLHEFHFPDEYLYDSKITSSIVYLCASMRLDWTPIDWSPNKRKGIIFKHIQKGPLMRLATWENDQLVYQSPPFMIAPRTNEITFFSADSDPCDVPCDVVLYSKYPIDDELMFRERMLGGVFEASNTPDFTEKDTLRGIEQMPYSLFTTMDVAPGKKYRYVRYYGGQNTHCNISEVAFFEYPNSLSPLKGIIMGTPGCAQNDGRVYTNVYDGSTETSFDYKEPSGGWAGLDLGEPKQIVRIDYTPRNRDNYIRPKDTYELFVCDKDWRSLGVVTSNTDSLVFSGVPKDGMFLLKNHSRGVQERIFTLEDGKQKWW